MHIDHWLQQIPHWSVYLSVGLVVMIESLGIPIPGEIVLVSAALLASRRELSVAWEWIALSAATGAIVGDSIGYWLGREFGQRLFTFLGRKFPKHFGEDHVAYAEHVFGKWGPFAVFFGRFVALLRIFAGPIAGSLRMHYPRFLLANALGGIVWAGGTTYLIYSLGQVAETWLSRFSYVGLAAALIVGIAISLVMKNRMNGLVEAYARERKEASAMVASTDTAG